MWKFHSDSGHKLKKKKMLIFYFVNIQISLFGYCGHSVIAIHGTFEDNFGNMWLYPNAQLMTAQFSVTNNGNTTAFVKICQGAI